VWVSLPEPYEASEVVKLAKEEGVTVAGGGMTEVPGERNAYAWGRRNMRVSISWSEEDELVEGCRRLGAACERWMRGERAGAGAAKADIK
jgi:DNA-binding transcriptional MocR family regulator